MAKALIQTQIHCYHCGDSCSQNPVFSHDKPFCCEGCKTVYELLEENDLCTYYDLDKNPGFKIKQQSKEKFAYLDEKAVADQLLNFNEGNIAKIRLYIPQIHCSSCIWLLENLYKLQKGIISSRVDFTRKEIDISYYKNEINLRAIVEILDSFGYTPLISLENYSKKPSGHVDRSLYYKIGIAGFCAGNIMLLSFPEYLGIEEANDSSLRKLFGYINLALSLPVVFYAAGDYFVSAWKGIKNKILNLDIPIALGTGAVFFRSVYEVLSGIGPGYFDSLTGLIFFLLIGKWVQKRTYNKFSFERDYQSYFPLTITKVEDGKEYPILIKELKKGDEILIRNNEIIPADAILHNGRGYIDYSFVSGEALPISKNQGDLLYAGGKQVGNAIKIKVIRDFSQSRFLQLWNKDIFTKRNDAYLSSYVLLFSKYFTAGTIVIASLTLLYWYPLDTSRMLFAVTSVLLVACPCSLALALPFALSNCLKIMGMKGLYLKNSDTVEMLSEIDTIVFDKTGTLTEPNLSEVEYVGEGLHQHELSYVRSAVAQSIHPLSQALYNFLKYDIITPDSFHEIPSKGIECIIQNNKIRIGSADFVHGGNNDVISESRVYLSINGADRGYYKMKNKYRTDMEEFIEKIGGKYELHLLSGDNDSEKERLESYFRIMRFKQSPQDKLEYVESLIHKGKKVLMLGDGLNDAGALKVATVGIAVSDNVYNFFPSSDGILEGKKLCWLPKFLKYSKKGSMIIKISLGISLLYNAIGLFFAVQGLLSPLIAAILMPLSSVSVVLFVIAMTNISALRIFRS